MKKLIQYFTKTELYLWIFSVLFILISFLIFDRNHYLNALASLIGVTSLILSAKAHPLGQFLMIIFSILYGIISYSFLYYGEMITYLGMTLPMSIFSFISWIRHPYDKNKHEVKVNDLSQKEIIFMFLLTFIITILFYFILKIFNTSYLILSTISVTTSFLAVYLSFRRSSYFALAYACNDLLLIVLWILATLENLQYISVVICFIVFFVNDLYGFINWKRIEIKQKS